MMSLYSLTDEKCGRERVRRLEERNAGVSPKHSFLNELKIEGLTYGKWGEPKATGCLGADWELQCAEITQFEKGCRWRGISRRADSGLGALVARPYCAGLNVAGTGRPRALAYSDS